MTGVLDVRCQSVSLSVLSPEAERTQTASLRLESDYGYYGGRFLMTQHDSSFSLQ